MRVCLYCRVATATQLDNWTMEAQRNRLKRYADDKGLEIIGQICEYGVGKTMNRPSLQEVAELVRSGHTDIVLIQNLSRLTRQPRAADDFLDLLHRHNVTLISIDERLELPPRRKQNTTPFASL